MAVESGRNSTAEPSVLVMDNSRERIDKGRHEEGDRLAVPR
jgi:hypothetical protein